MMSSPSPAPTDSRWNHARQAWNRFFHAEERPDALALIRILFCGVILVGVLQRLPYARLLISSDGAPAPMLPSIEFLIPTAAIAVAMYAGLALCLLAGMIGWQTRVALLAAAVLYPLVGMLDNISTMTKYTVIATHVLFLLALAPSAAAWSIDARFGSAARNRIAVWPRRVLQLFLCVVYFGTAITKVQTGAYHTGEQLAFWMLTDIHLSHPLGHWLASHPTLIVFACEATLIWEAIFFALIYVRPLRGIMLAFGVLFHLGTFGLLGLWIFPAAMLSLYPAFLDTDRVRRLMLAAADRVHSIGLPSLRPLRPLLSGTGFAAIMAVTLVTAVEAEYHLDPLDRRHPQRRPEAVALSPEEANTRLAGTGDLTPADWIYRVDFGTTIAAGTVVPKSPTLDVDERPTFQVWVHQPHPDFWLQADVHQINGQSEHLLYEGGCAVLREQRSVFCPLAESTRLQPGEYAVVLKYAGEELWRKPFTVVE